MTVDGPQIGAGMPETAERDGAFPRLDEGQMSRLRLLGERRAVEPGDVLFEAGDAESDFYVIESGAVAIVQGYGRENRVIALHGARRFLGELGMISGQRLYLTGVVRDRGAVIQVPLERLREIVSQDKALSDLILGAFIARRSILIDAGTGIKLIGSRFSPDSRRLREYLVRNRMPHQWIDLEEDEQADALLGGLAVEPDETPVVVASGGEILRKPTNAEVGRAIGIAAKGAPPAMCDLLVIGGGPAGLAASVYAASEGLDTQTIEAVATGGQAGTSAKIENYLGFPAGVSGSELTQRAGLQAIKFGVRLTAPAAAVGLRSSPGRHEIELSTGEVATGRAVVIATGAQYRRLDVPRLEQFEMGGVYYAATQAEAQLCMGDPVVIVGGANSAGQAALYFAQRSASVTMLVRGSSLRTSMSSYLVDQIEATPKVRVRTGTTVVEAHGTDHLEGLTLLDAATGEKESVDTSWLFIFIGAAPRTDWLDESVQRDEHGFVFAGPDLMVDGRRPRGWTLDRDPYHLETSIPGVFVAGDVRADSVKRVASAVGEGAMAVMLVHRYLERL